MYHISDGKKKASTPKPSLNKPTSLFTCCLVNKSRYFPILNSVISFKSMFIQVSINLSRNKKQKQSHRVFRSPICFCPSVLLLSTLYLVILFLAKHIFIINCLKSYVVWTKQNFPVSSPKLTRPFPHHVEWPTAWHYPAWTRKRLHLRDILQEAWLCLLGCTSCIVSPFYLRSMHPFQGVDRERMWVGSWENSENLYIKSFLH